MKAEEGGIGSVGSSVLGNVLNVKLSLLVSITVVGVNAVISFDSLVVVGKVAVVLLNILCSKNVESVVGGTLIGDGVFNVWSVSAAEREGRVIGLDNRS